MLSNNDQAVFYLVIPLSEIKYVHAPQLYKVAGHYTLQIHHDVNCRCYS